jgi:hypothetical protein
MWSVRISACKSQAQTMAAQRIPRVRCPKNEALWNSTPVTAVVSFESRKEVTEGLCPESRRPTPFESASAVKYLRLPTALRSKPAYRTPCSSRLSARRGMNLLASPTFCGPRFWKNSNGSETKIKPNNKSLFDCPLMAPRKIGGAAPTPQNCRAASSAVFSSGASTKPRSTPRFFMSVTAQLRGFLAGTRIRERDDMPEQ